jgi:uncharacterized protein (TIGR03437 family)
VQQAFRCLGDGGRCSALELDVGSASDPVVLLLFGTGIRWRRSIDLVHVTIGGEVADVLYAGWQLEYEGLDQVNVRLPPNLAGRGDVEVMLEVDGKQANTVTVRVR